MKRIGKIAVVTIFLLVLIISSLSFVACNPEEPNNPFLLNGTPLKDYTVVYDDADVFAKYAANILASEIKSLLNVDMSVVDDNAQEVDKEILVGNTNRDESLVEIDAIVHDYVFGIDNAKIVMLGNGDYMIGGAVNHFIEKFNKTSLDSNQLTIENLVSGYTYQAVEANSVILMIGDGMGFNTIEMARQSGVFAHFSAESLPIKGEAVTRSYSVMTGDAEYTDSAAGATALATGYKTNNKVIGKDHEGNNVKNVRELAYENGANTAVLTSDAMTGATPAGFTAHVPNRGNESLIESEQRSLLRSGSLMIGEGYLSDNNFLARTQNALSVISQNDSDFFIMIEEAYIDKTADDNDKDELMDIMERWNDVIAYVIEFTLAHPGTVLIITADHETGGITLGEDGNYTFTTTNHTNVNVPVYAFGAGTEIFNGVATENIDIAKFIASVYSDEPFGGPLPAVA